jgi:probable rRNA maturation factor
MTTISDHIDITIAIHDHRWHEVSSSFENYVEHVCRAVLTHQKTKLQEYCPAVLSEVIGIAAVFTDGKEIQQLNKQFRGKDVPTNVLSFAADMDGLQPDDQEIILGDMIFAYDVIAEEATAQRKHFVHHLTHMIVHGLLHLLGYDHIIEHEAEEMEAIESLILAEFSIPNPYMELSDK